MRWISIFIKETKPQKSIQTKSLLNLGHKVMRFHLEESIPCMNKSVSINSLYYPQGLLEKGRNLRLDKVIVGLECSGK